MGRLHKDKKPKVSAKEGIKSFISEKETADLAAAAFKNVESLCGVARIAISEALAHAGSMPEGELRQDAIETLEGTLTAILHMYNGEGAVDG